MNEAEWRHVYVVCGDCGWWQVECSKEEDINILSLSLTHFLLSAATCAQVTASYAHV